MLEGLFVQGAFSPKFWYTDGGSWSDHLYRCWQMALFLFRTGHTNTCFGWWGQVVLHAVLSQISAYLSSADLLPAMIQIFEYILQTAKCAMLKNNKQTKNQWSPHWSSRNSVVVLLHGTLKLFSPISTPNFCPPHLDFSQEEVPASGPEDGIHCEA